MNILIWICLTSRSWRYSLPLSCQMSWSSHPYLSNNLSRNEYMIYTILSFSMINFWWIWSREIWSREPACSRKTLRAWTFMRWKIWSEHWCTAMLDSRFWLQKSSNNSWLKKTFCCLFNSHLWLTPSPLLVLHYCQLSTNLLKLQPNHYWWHWKPNHKCIKFLQRMYFQFCLILTIFSGSPIFGQMVKWCVSKYNVNPTSTNIFW